MSQEKETIEEVVFNVGEVFFSLKIRWFPEKTSYLHLDSICHALGTAVLRCLMVKLPLAQRPNIQEQPYGGIDPAVEYLNRLGNSNNAPLIGFSIKEWKFIADLLGIRESNFRNLQDVLYDRKPPVQDIVSAAAALTTIREERERQAQHMDYFNSREIDQLMQKLKKADSILNDVENNYTDHHYRGQSL